MIIYKNEPLSTYEVFWHLYLIGEKSPKDLFALAKLAKQQDSNSEALLRQAALLVFKSIEEKGLHPLHSVGFGYCDSMPEEFTDEVVSDLLYSLDAIRPLYIQPDELRGILQSLLAIAEALASTEVEYEPPIKAFIVASDTTYIIRQGYQAEKNDYCINRDLEKAGYMPTDWLKYDLRSLERNGRIRHALVAAIADNYFGDTTIQVY